MASVTLPGRAVGASLWDVSGWGWLRGVPAGESRWQSLGRDDTVVQTQPTRSPPARGKGCHIQGRRFGGWNGSRTPPDAIGTGPQEDVECRGWKPLEGTPSQQGPVSTADPSWEAHGRSPQLRRQGPDRERGTARRQGTGQVAHGTQDVLWGTWHRGHGTWDTGHGTWHMGCIVGDAALEHGRRTRGYATEAMSWDQGHSPGGAAGTQDTDTTRG